MPREVDAFEFPLTDLHSGVLETPLMLALIRYV